MADWGPLREALAHVQESRTLAWSELDALVGGLPRSAYDHPAFWSGDRSQWRGFRTTDAKVGRSVTFVRHSGAPSSKPRPAGATPPVPAAAPTPPQATAEGPGPNLLLVTCVKEKLDRPAAARDLYVSTLFRKERAYAEASRRPWFILSAEHGLVAPDQWLAPYERYLPDTPASYRTAWGAWVVERLALLAGPLDGKTVEVHASASYVDAIRAPLVAKRAEVVEPLHGLAMGQRLAWYDTRASRADAPRVDFAWRLGMEADAVPPADFVARGADGLEAPGLYSWWVDDAGAAELSAGLGHPVGPGLIYAGLAGATRWPSGTPSEQTLWSRIKGNHLGGRHQGSTFRLTLGSVLAAARGCSAIDETALTEWMHQHLRVIAVPYDDADTLGRLEDDVLTQLEPPLNLQGIPATPLRARLTELRRAYGGA